MVGGVAGCGTSCVFGASTGTGSTSAGSSASRRVSAVCAVCAFYAVSTGDGSNFAGSSANRRVSVVSAVCVFYAFGTGTWSEFSGSISAAYSQVDGNFIADRSAKLRHIHLAI